MLTNDQFVRYKVLDRCFRNPLGGYSIEDLIRECEKAISAYHCEERTVGRRTIEKDLEEIQLRYNVVFRSDYKDGRKKLYQYEDTNFSLMKELLTDGNMEKQILQNVLDMLRCYEDEPQYSWLFTFLQGRIDGKSCDSNVVSFQNNPDLMGIEYFPVLLDCIIKNQVVRIAYRPYGKDVKILTVHPYQLKQFNDRWFLICITDGYETISNLALDRIDGEIERTHFPYIECPVNLREYYDDVIGVTVHPENAAQKILLRISKSRYGYILSKPFHSTQKEVHALEDENTKVIQIQVQVNNELEARILSFGNDVEVLEPLELRERVKKRIQMLVKTYQI